MGDASAGADPVVQRLRAAGCVWAQDEARLLRQAARGDPLALDRLVSRRIRGEPLEHVLGWADFAGRRVPVRRGVFVPRARTELLVRAATGLVAPADWVVDLCCGSAAVGLAVATRIPVRLVAVDIDVRAVAASRAALAQVARPGGGPRVGPADAARSVRPPLVRRGDLFQALPQHLRGRVALVVANAPYVPRARVRLMPRDARLGEPMSALDGGPDGMVVQRRIVRAAPRWLAPGGHLLIESMPAQSAALAAAMDRHGMTARVLADQDLGATAVLGTLRPGPPGRPQRSLSSPPGGRPW